MRYMYVKATKYQQTAYSLTREMYLAGCELHIQTLTFLVLTLKQYVNAKIT